MCAPMQSVQRGRTSSLAAATRVRTETKHNFLSVKTCDITTPCKRGYYPFTIETELLLLHNRSTQSHVHVIDASVAQCGGAFTLSFASVSMRGWWMSALSSCQHTSSVPTSLLLKMSKSGSNSGSDGMRGFACRTTAAASTPRRR